jgi:hypothetical protein
MAGKLDMASSTSDIAVKYAAVIAMTVLLGGCAAGSARVAPRQVEHVTGQGTPPIATVSEPVALRDPLAGVDPSGPTTHLGNRYARLVTTGLDGISEFRNRERSVAWNGWADGRLQNGDIVFVQSEGNLILGFIDFSKLTREVTESPFTHMGIVAVENGQTLIYDTNVSGPGRKTFGQMMAMSDIAGVAVKRLRRGYRQHIPAAVAYCRRVHEHQIGFDKKLRLDNDKLYCTEMVEVAFRSTGLRLSQPVRWNALPGFDKHSISINAIRIANQAKPDDFVIIPGNDQLGIWASPALELVLDLTDVDSPPPIPDQSRQEHDNLTASQGLAHQS